jgi:hypothetical protein
MLRRCVLSIIVSLSFVSLAAAETAVPPVPAFIKRPEFVNDLSKRTDDLASFLKRKGKKELTLLADEAAAEVTIELVSVTKNVTGVKNVNQIATAIAGRVIMESGDSYTAVVRLCIPAKEHCEEFTENDKTDWGATWEVAEKIRKFVKENAASMR